MSKYLHLSEAEVQLVIQAVNASKLSTYRPGQRDAVLNLVRKLGRFLVAPAQELREEVTGRKTLRGPGRPKKLEQVTTAEDGEDVLR